jgi:hypothetical protein
VQPDRLAASEELASGYEVGRSTLVNRPIEALWSELGLRVDELGPRPVWTSRVTPSAGGALRHETYHRRPTGRTYTFELIGHGLDRPRVTERITMTVRGSATLIDLHAATVSRSLAKWFDDLFRDAVLRFEQLDDRP